MATDVKRSPERAPDDEEETVVAEEETPAAVEPEPEPEEDDDQTEIEARARRLGWVPESEWRGKKDGWRPASEFLERGLANRGIADENLRRLEERHQAEIKELNTKLTESGEVLLAINERFKRADEAAYQRARHAIEAEMEAAVDEGDKDKYREAKGKLDAFTAPPEKTVTAEQQRTEQPRPHPAVKAWVDKNDWFNADRTLNSVATVIHGELLNTHPHLSLTQNLEEVTKQIKERFPDRFENERRRQPSSVRTPSGDRGSGRKGRVYADLPAEAKAACDKFVRQIPGYTKEEYLKTYEWDAPR